jgi:hypothetical protein
MADTIDTTEITDDEVQDFVTDMTGGYYSDAVDLGSVEPRAEGEGIDTELIDDTKGIFQTAFGKDSGGITVGEFFSGTVGSTAKNLCSKFKSFITQDPVYEDSITVKSSATTLLGNNFDTLYDGGANTDEANVNGVETEVLSPFTSYSTEMVSSYFTVCNGKDYDDLAPTTKAAYEITLLSKKYASDYVVGNDADNAELANEYTEKLMQYKDYCDNNGISWDETMLKVSTELQTESYTCKESSSQNDRDIANIAHKLMADGVGDTYNDVLIPTVADHGLTYEDTIDVEPEVDEISSFSKALSTVRHGLSKVTTPVANTMSSAWQTIKSKAAELADKIEPDGTFSTFAHNVLEKIGGDSDKSSERYDQAVESLGNYDNASGSELEYE